MPTLLDTTWLVEHLRKNPLVTQRVRELRPQGIAVSIISIAELYEGVFRSSKPDENESALQQMLGAMTILGITSSVARTYGQVQAALLRRGQPMGVFDLVIAATAMAHGFTLATFDDDFERIEGLDLLRA